MLDRLLDLLTEAQARIEEAQVGLGALMPDAVKEQDQLARISRDIEYLRDELDRLDVKED